MASTANELREEVRWRYAESARAVTGEAEGYGCGSGTCCADDSAASAAGSAKFGDVLYEAEQQGELPDAAVLAAIAVGGTVGLDAMFGGPITGASMNPARSIGPAFVSGNLHALWLYIVAPICGASLAALAYQFVRGEHADRPPEPAEALAEARGSS
jgi:hypothetical protein